MKNLAEIRNIVANMNDNTFEKINNADTEYFFGNSAKVRKNAYNRMVYNLKKCGLTVNEWFAWMDN